jgi:hypothetical protein
MGSGVLGGDVFEGFTVAWWWGLREGGGYVGKIGLL